MTLILVTAVTIFIIMIVVYFYLFLFNMMISLWWDDHCVVRGGVVVVETCSNLLM